MCDEGEFIKVAIYLTMDYYMNKYKLEYHKNKYFKLSNNFKYKVKFNYEQYIYFNYKTLFRGSNVGLNKDNSDGYVIVYPINHDGNYRQDFIWIIIKTDDLIQMIIDKLYISNEIGFFKSRYKFSVRDIIARGKQLF